MKRRHPKPIMALPFILCVIAPAIHAESNPWNYLNQSPPGETPVRFAPGIVSTFETLEHSAPAISPDRTEIYWSSIDYPLDQNIKKILYVKYEQGRWSEPAVAPFSGTHIDDSPFFPTTEPDSTLPPSDPSNRTRKPTT